MPPPTLLDPCERPAVSAPPARCWVRVAWVGRGAGAGHVGAFFPPVQGEQAGGAWVWAAAVPAGHLPGLPASQHCPPVVGARLRRLEQLRSRIAVWREGAGPVGVRPAAFIAAQLAGPALMLGVFPATLVLGWWVGLRAPGRGAGFADHAWRAPRPARRARRRPGRPAFRRLLVVFAQRHCQRHPGHAGAVLRARPVTGAIHQEPVVPGRSLRLRGAVDTAVAARRERRFGWPCTWLMGMLLAVAVFAGRRGCSAAAMRCLCGGVRRLGRGARRRPGGLPSALLSGRKSHRRHSGRRRWGRGLVGWWNFGRQAQPGPGGRGRAAVTAAGLALATGRERAKLGRHVGAGLTYAVLPRLAQLRLALAGLVYAAPRGSAKAFQAP